MMDINKKFEKNFNYEIIRKLSNSMWRWEMSYKSITSWNTIVDAYNCIRSVKIDNFDITLDYTTSCNEKGYSKFSRTYLDGVFAFLIHYNGEHVMTIGFTVLSNHRILINQVQLVKKHGNRFLFKMGNRIEWSIDLFHTFFKNFNIYLIKGIDLSQSIYEQYKSQYDSNNYHLKKAKENLRLNPSNEYNNWAINHYSLQLKECKSKIDLFRERTYNHIIKVYGVNLNRYRRCSSIKKMQLRFNFIKEKK